MQNRVVYQKTDSKIHYLGRTRVLYVKDGKHYVKTKGDYVAVSGIQGGTGTSPKGMRTSPKGTGTSPKGTGTSPKGTGTSPKGTGTSPKGMGTSPKGTGTSPKGTGTSPTKIEKLPPDVLRYISQKIAKTGTTTDVTNMRLINKGFKQILPTETINQIAEEITNPEKTIEKVGHFTNAKLSPDGTILAYLNDEKDQLYLSNYYNQNVENIPHIKIEQEYEDIDIEIADFVFSPDGSQIITYISDNSILFWSVDNTLKKTINTDVRQSLVSIAISPDGSLLGGLYSSSRDILLWNIKETNPIPRRITRNTAATENTLANYSIAFSPDGTTLATATVNTVFLNNIADGSGRIIFQSPTDPFSIEDVFGIGEPVMKVLFSPDGLTLVSSTIKTVTVCRISDVSILHTLRYNKEISDIAFNHDGTVFAVCSKTDMDIPEVKLYRTKDYTFIGSIKTTNNAKKVLFHPDGIHIITVESYTNKGLDFQTSFKIWNIKSLLELFVEKSGGRGKKKSILQKKPYKKCQRNKVLLQNIVK